MFNQNITKQLYFFKSSFSKYYLQVYWVSSTAGWNRCSCALQTLLTSTRTKVLCSALRIQKWTTPCPRGTQDLVEEVNTYKQIHTLQHSCDYYPRDMNNMLWYCGKWNNYFYLRYWRINSFQAKKSVVLRDGILPAGRTGYAKTWRYEKPELPLSQLGSFFLRIKRCPVIGMVRWGQQDQLFF